MDRTSEDARRFIGFVGHSTFLYDEMSAEENLNLFAQLYNLGDSRGPTLEEHLKLADFPHEREAW